MDPNVTEPKEKGLPGTFRFEMGGRKWSYPVEVSVRGYTSKYDCSFKKLSLKLDKKAEGPLAGMSRLRINTHCSEKQGYTEMGRVAGPAGPVREGVVYNWMRVLGLPTYLSTVVPISYKDLSTKRITQSFALLLESKKDLGSRLGGKVMEEEDLTEQEAFLDRVSVVARNELTLKGLLFNALIGNADYSLQLTDLKGERHHDPITPPSGMWNMVAVDYGNTIGVVPTDFDVSGVVVQTPEISDEVTKTVSGCPTGRCEIQFAQVQKWRAFFTAPVFASVSLDIQGKEAALKAVVNQNKNLNSAEKEYFRRSVDSFVDVLKKRLKVPVITRPTSVFVDAELHTTCGMENPGDGYVIEAPAGLPVKVLARNAKSVQVFLLDTRDQALSNPGGGSCGGKVFLPANISISADWPK